MDRGMHQVIQWKWEAALDDQQQAFSLQQQLCDWSQTTLKDELHQGVERYAPTHFRLHVDQLELDLGEMDYDDLSKTLPSRFRHSLDAALQRLFQPHGGPRASGLKMVSPPHSDQEALAFFLTHGVWPRWFAQAGISCKQLVGTLLTQQPKAMAALIRKLGKQEAVRKRLVWQLDVALLKRIIQVLEPQHSETILSFTEHLTPLAKQAKGGWASIPRASWLWTLHSLFVEQGTLFNTVSFFKNTLQQIAQATKLTHEVIGKQVNQMLEGDTSVSPWLPLWKQSLSESTAPVPQGTLWETLEQMLKNEIPQQLVAGEVVSLEALFRALTQQFPQKMTECLFHILREYRVRLYWVKQVSPIVLERGLELLAPTNYDLLRAYLFQITQALSRGPRQKTSEDLVHTVWEVVLAYLIQTRNKPFQLPTLAKITMEQICQKADVSRSDILFHLVHGEHTNSTELSEDLLAHSQVLSLFQTFWFKTDNGGKTREPSMDLPPTRTTFPALLKKETLEASDDSDVLREDCLYYLIHGKVSPRQTGREPLSVETMMEQFLKASPEQFVALCRIVQQDADAAKRVWSVLFAQQSPLWNNLLRMIHEDSTDHQWIYRTMPFDALLDKLRSSDSGLASACLALQGLHQIIPQLKVPGMDSGKLRQALLEFILDCWIQEQWNRLSPEQAWAEWVWWLVRYHRVAFQAMAACFQTQNHLLPPNMRLVPSPPAAPSAEKSTPLPNWFQQSLDEFEDGFPSPDRGQRETSLPESQLVSNAGLVLIQGYLSLYLERLGLLQNQLFVSQEAQCKAAHCLQFLATGQMETEEHQLLLNKVLCGCPVESPMKLGMTLTPEEVALAESLLQAVMEAWPEGGAATIDGFRGNWLVRDGVLSEKENHWSCAVEKKVYDVLLNKAPFSFSIINFSWMAKPLHVTWSY